MTKYELVTRCIKRFPRYILGQLGSYSQKVNSFLNEQEYLSYEKITGIFSISNGNLNWDQRVTIRRLLMSKLRLITPRFKIPIDDIITGYYDQCLERYLYQRKNRLFQNSNTCWLKYAQNNKCISWINPKEIFDEDKKIQLLRDLGQRKELFKNRNLINYLERDKNGFVFLRSNNIYTEDDNILELFTSINNTGFSNIISTAVPIILGYSLKTERYNVICGRHRIAVLRYLRSQGRINNLKIKCHLVRYPFETLAYTRPFTQSCKNCDWGGIYDLGKGTHQDFYVREGIAVIRGLRNKKGGRQKWEKIKSIFREMVEGRKILDVGAHRGLFCLKSLEYGAKSATAIERNEKLTKVICTIKKNYTYEDFKLIKGDFYNNDVFQNLSQGKYDIVFFFGIIHHLLRLGIEKGILYSFDELLERISKITNFGVLIEFAMPRESSLSRPDLSPYLIRFSEKEFVSALRKYFPNYKNMGLCNYQSGNKYGRFMYYGLKG